MKKQLLQVGIWSLRLTVIAIFLVLNIGFRIPMSEVESMKMDRILVRMQRESLQSVDATLGESDGIALGRAVYRRLNSATDALRICFESHLGDCMAGVAIEFAKEQKLNGGSQSEFAERLEREICLKGGPEDLKNRERKFCYFHVGQGLMELVPGNLKRALALCETIKSQPASTVGRCAGGVYRRWYALNSNVHWIGGRLNLRTCAKENKYLEQCLRGKLAAAHERWKRIGLDYGERCDDFGRRSNACYRAFGATLIFSRWKAGQLSGKEVCRQGTAMNQANCFQSVMEQAFSDLAHIKKDSAFCDQFGSEAGRDTVCRQFVETAQEQD